MHVHVGVMEFAVFVLYYVILKAIIQLVHLEVRRRGNHTASAVSGLFA